ncbi:MAG: flagellar basal-body rod protein FlgF [Bdellovibrionales bacterium]
MKSLKSIKTKKISKWYSPCFSKYRGELYMSSKGIYTALSGAMAQQNKLDTIANNMANANTTGFKKDQQVFKEYLTAYEKSPDVIQVPKVPASIDSFYHMQGSDKSYVDGSGTYTDFSQGVLKRTGNALDVAIEGKALFEVNTPVGVRYTRNGSFNLNAEGTLVTKQGYPVLQAGDGPAESRQIRINPGLPLAIGPNGSITQPGGANVGRLSVLEFTETDALKKIGNSLYSTKPNFEVDPQQSTKAVLHQASLESSNVNVVQEMTEMIKTTRTFESLQKAMQAYDSIDNKLVNDVPKF